MRPQEQYSAKSWLLLDLALSFMFCIFAPLEAFFSNESEYWFKLSHLLPAVVPVFLAVFACLALLSAILRRTKLNAAAYALFLLVLFFFYIQGNYIPRPYGVLNGDQIDWNGAEFRPLSVMSLVLFLFVAAAWICALCVRSVRQNIFVIGGYACSVLLSLQSVTLITLYLQNDVFGEGGATELAVSSDGMFEFSKTNNVIIVLLDTFDASYLNAILDGGEKEFAQSVLRDFTYYPDTLGLYPTTMGALPHLLTGVVYSNDVPYRAYVERAYRENPLYESFAGQGYSLGVYTISRYLPGGKPLFENVQERSYGVAKRVSFAKTVFKLVGFNYLPHPLKKGFVVSDDVFMQFRKSKSTQSAPFDDHMVSFYGKLSAGGADVKASHVPGVFRFYHLEGVHPPAKFGKDLAINNERSYTLIDEALGCLTAIDALFSKLREVGAYDSSSIIVLADHGYVNYRQNPVFLVKNRGESHDLIVSKEKMSYGYWFDLLLPLVRDGKAISEDAIRHLAEAHPVRTYLNYEWDNAWDRKYLPVMEEMRLLGNASLGEGSILEKTGVRFGNLKDRKYVLGNELTFGKGGSAVKYIDSGFFQRKDFHWTQGYGADMHLELDGLPNRLFIEYEHMVYSTRQSVELLVNGTSVARYRSRGRERRRFQIPPSCLREGKTLSLHFNLPDAISPDEVKHNGDMRKLALGFYWMRIYGEDSLSFAGIDGAPARKLCLQGVGLPERGFTWTVGDKLEMSFSTVPQRSKPLAVTLHYGTFLPREHVIVSANGRQIEDYVAKGDQRKKISIPSSLISEDGTVSLSFSFPDAVSPKKLGKGDDDRRLALRLYSLDIK